MRRSIPWTLVPVLALVWLLSGCAGGYLLDNEVQAFSQLTAVPAQPTYRFERLPSQQVPEQAQFEAMADTALHKAGMRRDDASPRYSVQVSGRIQLVRSPWSEPWGGWGWGPGPWHRHIGLGFGGPFGRMETPWHRREVAVIMRELSSNRVVFESRASNSGPWMDIGYVFPAMFEAAMQGFPTPPPGPRMVNVQLAR